MTTTLDPRHARGPAARSGAAPCPPATPSDRARRRMLRPGERPLFLADWTEVLFVHLDVDPAALQPHVPFRLDTFRGRAYVSLVAFTQRNLRPRVGGRLAALASRPLAEHEFLNVRTYVRHGRGRGIYFLAEWIPNRLACLVGPPLYGLPYRAARNRYACRVAAHRRGTFAGTVNAPAGRLAWRARVPPTRGARPARRGLERFLLERYTAFTRRGRTPLRFRVWHEPWIKLAARVSLTDTGLLDAAFPWLPTARVAAAHYSPGVRDVWIGPPRRVGETAEEPTVVRPMRPGGAAPPRRSQNCGLFSRAAAACRAALSNSSARTPSRAPIETTKGVV